MIQPPPTDAPVTVSIVSHQQWGLLAPLLDQLNDQCAKNIALVVVTANLDEAIELNPHWRIAVQVVRNQRPAGFGANHNAAFVQWCHTHWFLVLNPDIRLDADVLGELLQAARPKAGLLAPRVQEPNKREPEPYRGLPTPAELLGRRSGGHTPPRSAAWVPGMFMLLRTDAFSQVRGFDEKFFMYCEDVDLCARIRLAGWQLQLEESVTVRHEAQRASHSALRPLAWHMASLLKLWTSRPFHAYRRMVGAEVSASSSSTD